MSLQQWHENHWILDVDPAAQEVANALAIARRDIADASLTGMSSDNRFGHAYNAVRALCELALHASGYRVSKGGGGHQRAIESLKFTLGAEWVEQTDYFDRCRRKRHQSMYDRSGVTQPKDADDLLDAARNLLDAVQEWLGRHHSRLMPNDG